MDRWISSVALASVLGLLAAACGNTSTTASTRTPATTATTAATTTLATAEPTATPPATTAVTTTTIASTTTTFAGPSAADDLEDFLTAAEALDAEIAAAAVVFNRGFDEASGSVSEAAVDAIHALDVGAVTALIPAGLDVDLETAVLAVYADLESRIAALDGGVRYLNQGEDSGTEFTMECLALGSGSNARFDDDLAAAKRLALLTPPPAAAADSAEAGILAVRIETIRSMNWGCDSCGGVVVTDPIPVDWAGRTVVDGVGFDATFAGGEWEILIYAC